MQVGADRFLKDTTHYQVPRFCMKVWRLGTRDAECMFPWDISVVEGRELVCTALPGSSNPAEEAADTSPRQVLQCHTGDWRLGMRGAVYKTVSERVLVQLQRIA